MTGRHRPINGISTKWLSRSGASRYNGVRALFDNPWLHLFSLDEAGRLAWRYADDLQWTAMSVAADLAAPLKMEI
ncbi:hypothetical protein SIL87_19915 [Acidiphilium acidophilum]|uniref:Uncharacterized protein n=1 Tax=Acidiphilium acidophilum TaxID=76588 RepID=A0AAW9DV74_ACIAO|nr:hypothetical protein [Acidiphilium acidophilum]